jgi:hypothetical protein
MGYLVQSPQAEEPPAESRDLGRSEVRMRSLAAQSPQILKTRR